MHPNPGGVDGINDVAVLLTLGFGVLLGCSSGRAESVIVAEHLLAPFPDAAHEDVQRGGTVAIAVTVDDTFGLFQTARSARLVLP